MCMDVNRVSRKRCAMWRLGVAMSQGSEHLPTPTLTMNTVISFAKYKFMHVQGHHKQMNK